MSHKFFTFLSVIIILLMAARALLKPQHRKILHENMQLFAKILLMVMVMASCIAIYRRYF